MDLGFYHVMGKPTSSTVNTLLTRIVMFVILMGVVIQAKSAELPESLQAVLLSKILNYEQTLTKKKQFSVLVLNEPSIYEAFNKLKATGKQGLSISKIAEANELPEQKFDLIYLNDETYLVDALLYAEKYNAVIATGDTTLVKKGVTIGMGTEKGKPKFYLNLSTSFAAGLNWQPEILKVVNTYP